MAAAKAPRPRWPRLRRVEPSARSSADGRHPRCLPRRSLPPGREHDEAKEDRLDRLRNVEPDTARLMAVLVRATRPARMLELGSSNGYSTIWLADAARAVGAELVSVELDPARSEQARRNL